MPAFPAMVIKVDLSVVRMGKTQMSAATSLFLMFQDRLVVPLIVPLVVPLAVQLVVPLKVPLKVPL